MELRYKIPAQHQRDGVRSLIFNLGIKIKDLTP
jgi:hypothetical protein